MVVAGFILNRFNVSMTGMVRASGVKYVPSWMEISVTIALVFAGIALFGLAARYLNIFPLAKPCLEYGQTCRDKPSCCLATLPKLWISIVVVVSLTLLTNGIRDFRRYQPPKAQASTVAVKADAMISLPSDYVFPKSSESPGFVSFSHANHMAIAERCADCHESRFSMLAAPKVGADMHSIELCGKCHDGSSARNACDACHQERR
jgi:c(7)-type cytochrome triheme protein